MIRVVIPENQAAVNSHILIGIRLAFYCTCYINKFTDVQHRPIYEEQLTTDEATRRITFFIGDNCINNRRAGFNLLLQEPEILVNGQRE